MAANIETSIWLAIKSRTDFLLPAYAKAYPGETFTPPFLGNALLPYLRIGRVSAVPTRRFIDNGQGYEHQGFFIITLVYPLGQAVEVYDQIAGSIAEYFNDETKMRYSSVCVSVPSYPQILEGFEDNGYWAIPVRVAWRCFA